MIDADLFEKLFIFGERICIVILLSCDFLNVTFC